MHKGNKRALAALGAAVGLAVTGCGGQTGGAAAATNTGSHSVHQIDFANFSDNGALFNGLQAGVVAAAQQAGIKLRTYNNNGDASTTLSNAHLIALDKPDAVLEYNPVADSGQRLGALFDQSKIPCVAVNIPFPGCAWFNQSDQVLATQMATTMSALMKQKGWTGSNTTAVIMESSQAGPSVNVAVWDDYAELSKLVPGMTPVKASSLNAQTTTIGSDGLQIDGGNTLETAFTAMQQGLQTIPRGRNIVFFSVDDDQTLGAWRALTQAGRGNTSMITGFGGDKDALDGLRTNSAWVAENCSFFTSWGQYLIALATAVAEGAHAPNLTLAPEAVLTKSNVNTYFPGESTSPKVLPPLPAQDKFLLKTGVLQKFHDIQGIQ